MVIEDKIYIAGFFDGEGCVTIRYDARHDYHTISVSISQNERNILEWICEEYGGKIYSGRHGKFYGYEWVLYRKNDIIRFLNDILPSLRIKKDQAIIGLKFCETINVDNIRGRTEEDFRQKRIYLKNELANTRLVH